MQSLVISPLTFTKANNMCLHFGFCSAQMLTSGQSKKLSSYSKHSTQQAFVWWETKNICVNDLPAVITLIQIITAPVFFYVISVTVILFNATESVTELQT